MKKLLLLAFALGFAHVYPVRHEHAPDACAALDHRLAALLGGVAGARAAHGISLQARAYAQARFAWLPPEEACVVVYWGTMLRPAAAGARFMGYLAVPGQ